MTFPVLVQPIHGQFEATLAGVPDVRATAPTRAEALAALEAVIARRLVQGELVAMEVKDQMVSGPVGKDRSPHSILEIAAVHLGEVLPLGSSGEDLLGEMLEERP